MALRLAAVGLLVVATVLPGILSGKFPNYVKVCKKNDPDFDACVIDSVESLRPRLSKGIPKLQVPPSDPFVLPTLEIKRDLEAIKVHALLQNIVAYGGNAFVINKLKTDLDKLALELSVTLPHIHSTADFDVTGRILGNIKGKGAFTGNFTDVKVDVAGDAKVVTRKGEEYLEVNNIKTKIGIGSSEVKIASKDKDKDKNDELLESFTRFYKQNEKQVLNILMPIVQETAEEIVTQISNKILSTIPLKELLPA
ncbi:putative beta-carotene-binding protein [Zootermopsis nevadensis]|uniref:Circadian clock-controlled protein n=1 Tax=Zootermopsis nevadensis TaxID=136037 RepID=A0A067QXJ1_ZOONE|nr:putative beta-carotene-binding protein [Zootermopsis nevadensis]KDR14110.1 Circadian clock-controlled protein [Zootermopsis nevadensis]